MKNMNSRIRLLKLRSIRYFAIEKKKTKEKKTIRKIKQIEIMVKFDFT